ncbi:DUF6382 domain-containing protein [Paenibacillus sp. IITD108]|uniref:DUF6382 domain-containing protein n=1 Tax=Paenibacillus sp. IITD108 TaxID=3116649 RepID=UPI002F416D60
MRSLKVDFCMNRGHEMIIDREGGIKRTELDELELQMLRSSTVPHLLPVDWLEIDGNCTFRFSLTEVTMLSHRLQREPLTMHNYYVLVLGLVDALIQCEEYMLRFEGCLLQDQFIFVGGSWQDIKLAYLPLSGEEAVSRHTDLLATIVRWTSYVDKIDGSGLKRLLHLMNVSHWPIEELRAALLDLIGAKAESEKLQHSAVDGNGLAAIGEEAMSSTGIAGEIRTAYAKPDVEKQFYTYAQNNKQPEPQASLFYYETDNEQMAPDLEKEQGKAHEIGESESEQEKQEAVKKLGKTGMRMALLAALLCSALVWRFVYLNDPNQQKLLISGAATLLFFGLAIFISKRNSRMFIEPTGDEFEHHYGTMNTDRHAAGVKLSTEFELHSGELRNNRWHFDKSGFSEAKKENSRQQVVEPLQQVFIETEAAGKLQQPAMEVLSGKSSISEPTVLLAREDRPHAGAATMSWLKRVWEGKEERVELIQPSFRIGRNGGPASYVEAAEGISRLHIEIERHTDGYCAKDLGSRNGSMLNGEQMIPYKQYKLEYGDQIQLAGKNGPVYELKTG